MNEKSVEISLRARTEIAARQAGAGREIAAVEAELAGRAGKPPRPGELYVVAETADHAVEWLVADADPRRPNRLLVVPADTLPLVGSADVAVDAGDPGGPLALRCRYGTWIDAGLLRPKMRTGAVGDETFERVRGKRQELGEETLTASTEQVETDADPEYGLWIENVLVPARAALETPGRPRLRLIRGTAAAAGASGRRRLRWRPALAAALPLAAGLAWLLVWYPGPRPEPEVVTLVLAMSTRTGGEPTLTVPPAAELVELRVDLEGDDDYDRFRATLTTVAGVEVWSDADLEKNAAEWGSEVVVRLPAAQLASGDYEIALEGLTAGGEVSAVGFYGFRVVAP